MKPIAFLLLACMTGAVFAQESEGYDEYAAGMETKRTKIKVNVHHKINQPINKSKRLMNDALTQSNAQLSSTQRTTTVGSDVLNYGGLHISGNTPVKANNIVVISRPGGMNGLEGNHVRPTPVRPTPTRPGTAGSGNASAADPYSSSSSGR